MGIAARYWRLVRIDGSGRRKVEEMAIAKAFFQQQFADLAHQSDVPDAPIQRSLMQEFNDETPSTEPRDRDASELCLRCFISHQIEQVCVQLEAKFGAAGGFTRYDLFPLVLDDDGRISPRPFLGEGNTRGEGSAADLDTVKTSSPERLLLRTTPKEPPVAYQTMASQILQTFDPDRAGLSTWTTRQVRQHPELTHFLMQHGIYLISDWALLNNTRPEQLPKLLSEFHALSQAEIEQACLRLQAYHEIYRQDRLQQRQLGIIKGSKVCAAPTADQLTRMAKCFERLANQALANESLLSRLQTLATQLRQYRIHLRTGSGLVTESLDQPETRERAAAMAAPEAEDQPEQQEFLSFYREQLMQCLDLAIQQATRDRVAYLSRKTSQTAHQFLTALHLFHCQGQSMGEIARQVGLEAQYQVTRLMKLKEFRARVQQQLLQLLCDRVLEKAKFYTDPARLHELNHTLEVALNEQVSTVLQQAETEAVLAKQGPLTSLFSRRLCSHLDTQRTAS